MTASPGPLEPFTRRELIESLWQPSERPSYRHPADGFGRSTCRPVPNAESPSSNRHTSEEQARHARGRNWPKAIVWCPL